MRMHKTELQIISKIRSVSNAIKYVTLSYLLYLILPPLTLMRYIDTINLFNDALSNNTNLATKLVNEIIFYHETYAIIFSITLILLSITMINQYLKIQEINIYLELESNRKLNHISLIWCSYAIALSIIVIFLMLSQINTIRNQLLESIVRKELLLNIEPEPLRTLIVIHEILFGTSIITYGYNITEISSNYEIFQSLKTPGKILVAGGLLFNIETTIIGVGLGPILIIIALYSTRKNLEKIRNKLSE